MSKLIELLDFIARSEHVNRTVNTADELLRGMADQLASSSYDGLLPGSDEANGIGESWMELEDGTACIPAYVGTARRQITGARSLDVQDDFTIATLGLVDEIADQTGLPDVSDGSETIDSVQKAVADNEGQFDASELEWINPSSEIIEAPGTPPRERDR